MGAQTSRTDFDPARQSSRGFRRCSGSLSVPAAAVASIALVLLASLSVAALLPTVAAAKPSEEPFAIVPASFKVTPSILKAGAHPDLTIAFDFAHDEAGETFNDVKSTAIDLPPGFGGQDTIVPTCTFAQLYGAGLGEPPQCSPESQVGTVGFEASVLGSSHMWIAPLYNMELSGPGVVELGFKTGTILTQTFALGLGQREAGLTATIPEIAAIGEIHNVSITIWGVPAAAIHDPQRGLECSGLFGEEECKGGGEAASGPLMPLLDSPTSCTSEPLEATIEASSWEEPQSSSKASTEVGPFVECEKVPFDPRVEVRPGTDSAESPSGLEFGLEIPQGEEGAEGPVASSPRDAVLTLPEGMTLNPAGAAGLGVCTPEDFKRETTGSAPGEGCPGESAIGTVGIKTPAIPEEAVGTVYLAEPYRNPFDSLLALYLVARVPDRGIVITAAGKVTPNPQSGQLSASFDEAPQLSFSKLDLGLDQGATAPLITPPLCGEYAAQAELTPYSAPLSADALSAPFAIAKGAGGGACPPGAAQPFRPTLSATSPVGEAGRYSALDLQITRSDGEQEITRLSAGLPPGLLANLTGVPYCPDAAIEAARARTGPRGGQEEERHPSCPAASEIGHTTVEAGVGSVPAQASGHLYLAGPYHGSPLSVVAITPARVGPFDLGTAVVREGLLIDPETAAVSTVPADSDPIPRILAGIALHIRDIRIELDRPDFILDPTGCEPLSVSGTLTGSAGAVLTDESGSLLTEGCQSLGFSPSLGLRLLGGTRRNGHPRFRAIIHPRPGDADIAHLALTLPPGELLDPRHLHEVCAQSELEAGGCPPASIYGYARVTTPILSEPLTGPVYLRASPGHGLPGLLASLHGRALGFDLAGRLNAARGRIRETFASLPDVPISQLVLETRGGRRGLLVNSADLCSRTGFAAIRMVAHNGKARAFRAHLNGACAR